MYKSLVALFHTPAHTSPHFLYVYKCDWPLALAHVTQWIGILAHTHTHTHTHIKRGRRECDATFSFFFPLAHPWQLKKSISEVHKKKIQNKRTQATQIQRHSWKRVQVAMYKSEACRLQPLRALLAPVSACLGNAAVSR